MQKALQLKAAEAQVGTNNDALGGADTLWVMFDSRLPRSPWAEVGWHQDASARMRAANQILPFIVDMAPLARPRFFRVGSILSMVRVVLSGRLVKLFS